jgi:hypothetical protein
MTCPCPAQWPTILSALLVPVLAVVGSLIAYRQWRTAQNKLKLDLFDRRFEIYKITRDTLGEVMSSGRAKWEKTVAFLQATASAKWLLDDTVATYLENEIYRRLVDLETLQSELEGVGVGPERTANVQRQSEIKKWLMSQFAEVDRRFEPYLKLGH